MSKHPAQELASVRRRLTKAKPGRLQELRVRQTAALHQILKREVRA